NPQRHLALFGKLERIREQILQDLLEPLFVGVNHGRQSGSRAHREPQAFVLGDLVEGALDVVLQPREALGRNVERDGTRFDLRQIENIVDEGKEIRACGIDGLRVIDLFGLEVLACVVREQLRQDQQAVQRRTQLVRHVGQKLDRKSTRLNSSHEWISYAVFCLKKK